MTARVTIIGLIATLIVIVSASCKKTAENTPVNAIFISMDTTRYDHIDTGASARAYTPEIRKFCRQAVVFENAFTPIPQTLPAHLSVLSSHLPNELGVLGNENEFDGRIKTLQEVLKEKGYYTAAVISLGTLSSRTGFNRGFDEFCEDLFEQGVFFAPAEKVTERAVDIIERNKNRNFFLFLHYSDPHSPYAPPRVKADFQILVDGEVVSSTNAYHGAILRMSIPLKKGTHKIQFKIDGPQNASSDFNHFVIRRLKIGKTCSLSYENLTYAQDLYGGSHLLKGAEGSVQVQCNTDTDMKLFQVIPILNRWAAADYYRQEVEYMDRWLGRLLRRLETNRLMKRTAIVLFADHGEGLGERAEYFGHVRYLNRQFIHVPLIVYLPGVKPGRIHHPVSLTTISPTILEALHIQDAGFSTAKSSLKLMRQSGLQYYENNFIYSFAYAPSAQRDKFTIIHWPYQGIFYLDGLNVTQKEFYNLAMSPSFTAKDQHFEVSLIKHSKPHYRNLLREMKTARRAFITSIPIKAITDEATMAKLQTLGYMGN